MSALFSPKRVSSSPVDGVDVVLADLDGVVYAGRKAIPHAVESLNRAQQTKRVGYITNNASRTDVQVSDHLRELGLSVVTEDVVTSPQAAMALLASMVELGSTILVIGGEGLTSEVVKAGFVVTESANDNPAAVVQGFSPDVGWRHLAEASFALNARDTNGEPLKTPWVATNMDWTIPVERGIAPGNGTLVSAVHLAVGRLPVVAGKPEVPIFEEAMRRFETNNVLFIGDRLDTDILGANRAGIASAIVLTGIDRAKQLLAAPEGSRPTYILGDLRELHEPYPESVTGKNGSVTVRGARVRKQGMDIVIEREGDNELDLLRAACQVIWDSGLAIYGFNVPERLYV
ncbi:MAG: HAD-IIA family hydrolase [Actinomycetales bacterium]|nr:HAD-IIA family hydrolase [Actinomycetales bacterium]